MGLTCHHPPMPRKPGGRKNWVEETSGHLPKYIECRARAIYWESGVKDVSRAIKIAVGVTEDEAEGRRKVSAKTRALAQAAVAEWNKMRAQARVS